MAEKKRKYERREWRLIYEWVRENYPTDPQWMRQRIGPIPGTPAEAIYKGLRRWVDLIILHDDTIILVEAKMRPMPEGVAELELYNKLFPKTPEFSRFKDLPRKLIYLTTAYDEIIDDMCKEKGIELVVFRPEWVIEWEKEWAERRG